MGKEPHPFLLIKYSLGCGHLEDPPELILRADQRKAMSVVCGTPLCLQKRVQSRVIDERQVAKIEEHTPDTALLDEHEVLFQLWSGRHIEFAPKGQKGDPVPAVDVDVEQITRMEPHGGFPSARRRFPADWR
jgi:hypothetical protein